MTNLSALLAGFAMASFLQFNFDDSTVNIGVLIAFGLTTSVVVRPWYCKCVTIYTSV